MQILTDLVLHQYVTSPLPSDTEGTKGLCSVKGVRMLASYVSAQLGGCYATNAALQTHVPTDS